MEAQSERLAEATPTQSTTMIRVCVLGPLKIEWEGQATPFPQERLHGRGVAPALLTQPNRFATRDWIMEQFWPESTHNRAEERLDDVASSLRILLRPPGSQEKLLHYVYGSNGRGSGYRLEGYPLLWVDADAFAWSVEQAARFERFGQDTLPFWEHAYQLAARGTFLPEEIYSDWATERRDLLAGQYRQCVYRLTTLLRERGATEQAILHLRSYWQVHPTDEDVLRPLMELLGEQERYQEVEEYYFQAREELKREHKEFDHRTKDIFEYIRTKPIQRKKALRYAIAAPLTGYFPPSTVQDSPPIALPQLAFPHEVFLDQTLEQLSTIVEPSIINREFLNSPFIEIQKNLFHIIDTSNLNISAGDKEEYILSRRQALLAIATLALPLFASSEKRLSRMSIDVFLSSLATSIQSCWLLSNTTVALLS